MDRQLVLVLGSSITGLSLSRFLIKQGFRVIVTDDDINSALTNDDLRMLPVEIVDVDTSLQMLDDKQVRGLFTSPGVKITHPLIVKAKLLGIDVCGDIELGLKSMGEDKLLFGITGTNGKTTTTLVTTHILNQAGKKTKALGNVGEPFLDNLQTDRIILEISSQQLEYTKQPRLDSALIVNISPNHIDWHGSYEQYFKAKIKILSLLKPGAACFVHHTVKSKLPFKVPCPIYTYGSDPSCDIAFNGRVIRYFGTREFDCEHIFDKTFAHDIDNFLAAYALCREAAVTPEECVNGYVSFQKPLHRIQYVGSSNGIEFYDDSKGTNVEATIRALQSMKSPVHLIAGGVHKGEPYCAWATHCKDKLVQVFAIGQAAEIIRKDLEHAVPVKCCVTLKDAFESAVKCANPGDIVLLSPGCSSWDMFQSYKERGEKFQALAKQYMKTTSVLV